MLESPYGSLILRLARKLYTTCPSPGQAAQQRRDPDVDQRKGRLKRALDALLNPDPSRRIKLVVTIPPPSPGSGAKSRDELPHQLIVEPRCKVCCSPHRAEIDLRLAAGYSQVDVRRHANELAGGDHFTANNISTHLRKHVNEADPRVRRLLETRLERQRADQRRRYEQAVEVVEAGLEAIQAGVIDVTPSDLMPAIQLLDQREAPKTGDDNDLDEMRREFDAFMEAVHDVVGDEKWQQVVEAFERRRAQDADSHAYAERRRLLEPGFSFI